MSAELDSRLADLAQKLGTSVDHLWEVLKRQALIDGFGNLATALVSLAAIVAVAVLWRKIPVPGAEVEAPAKMLRLVIAFGVICFGLMIFGNNLWWAISDFVNPEFYAWRQLR